MGIFTLVSRMTFTFILIEFMKFNQNAHGLMNFHDLAN
jgi:hypothetical protein